MQNKYFQFSDLFIEQIQPSSINYKQKKYLQTAYINIKKLNQNAMSYLTNPDEGNYINIQAISWLLELMNILTIKQGFEFLDEFEHIDNFITKWRKLQKKLNSILLAYNQNNFGLKEKTLSPSPSIINAERVTDLQKYYQYQTHFSTCSQEA